MKINKRIIRDDIGRVIKKGLPDPLNKTRISKFELDAIMTDDPIGQYENTLLEDDE